MSGLCHRLSVATTDSLERALAVIDAGSRGLALVLDATGRLEATLTDGDIRRHLLEGGKLVDPVTAACNRDPLTAGADYDPAGLLEEMSRRGIRHVPVLEAGRPVGLLGVEELAGIPGVDDLPAVLAGRPFFADPLPVARPTLPSYEELEPGLREVIAGGMLTNGPQKTAFEAEAAEYLDVDPRRVIATANCTTGLLLALSSLEAPGEVVMPSFTYFATGLAATWNGLTPVFVEARRDDYTLDVAAAAEAITGETRALVAVYTFGCPPDLGELTALARERGLPLILDAAHAFGTRCGDRPAGTLGDLEVFSLSPTKPVTAAEGGLLVCRELETAERLRRASNLGLLESATDTSRGLNGRLSELNAVVGRASLRAHEANLARRLELVELYRADLGEIDGLEFQALPPDCRSTYKDFAVLCDAGRLGLSRDELARGLAAENIATKRYFDPPLHLQRRFSGLARTPRELPVTEEIAARVLCLPLFSHMEPAALRKVGSALRRLLRHRDAVAKRLRELEGDWD